MLTRIRIEVEGEDSAAATEEALTKYEHALQVTGPSATASATASRRAGKAPLPSPRMAGSNPSFIATSSIAIWAERSPTR